MYGREQVILGRDVDAIQIPDGTMTTLEAGSPMMITQELGGSITVMSPYGAMYRIDEKNFDALGREVPEAPDVATEGSLEDRVWEQLKKCYDPEIPVNIVDLGLVYDCRVGEPPAEGEDVPVQIKMTLTAPGCGMGPVLAMDVKTKVEDLPGVSEADVEVVLDPPWNQNMMTEAAKLQLGFL